MHPKNLPQHCADVIQNREFSYGISGCIVVAEQNVLLGMKKIHSVLIIIQRNGKTLCLPPVMNYSWMKPNYFWDLVNKANDDKKGNENNGIKIFFQNQLDEMIAKLF